MDARADTSTLNQNYFNELAAQYDVRHASMMSSMMRELRNSLDFIGFRTGGKLLDYACGTGLLSVALGESLSQCIGIDVSESMVQAYNDKARSENNKRSAYVGNFMLPLEPNPPAFTGEEFSHFDLVGVGAGFHHFDDCQLAARRLSDRLRPGGVLLITDFLVHAEDPSLERAGVRHHGFTEAQIRSLFKGAGVTGNFRFKMMEDDVVYERALGEGKDMVRRVFFARGEKVDDASSADV